MLITIIITSIKTTTITTLAIIITNSIAGAREANQEQNAADSNWAGYLLHISRGDFRHENDNDDEDDDDNDDDDDDDDDSGNGGVELFPKNFHFHHRSGFGF